MISDKDAIMRSQDHRGRDQSPVGSRSHIVFLVWDREGIRASGISKYLGASLHFLFTSKVKHLSLIVKTLLILNTERPKVIVCQSPPITCAFVAMLYRYIFAGRLKPKVIIDAHTGGILRPWSKTISKFLMRRASANIVINDEQRKYLNDNYQINPIVLEDPIPDFSGVLSGGHGSFDTEEKALFNVAVISSFSYDEPLQPLLDAASSLPGVYFYITGDKRNAKRDILKAKLDNVIFTGFLEHGKYIDLLKKADVIVDLTTESTSIVAGGFEAVALERPLIVSNWPPLRRYFTKGTIYVNNTADEIRQAISFSTAKRAELSREMAQLKAEKVKEWQEKMVRFDSIFH